VLGGEHPSGVVIATFGGDPPRYLNDVTGESHAAIFLEETPRGSLRVLDCWQGRAVGERVIRDRQGSGDACNDAGKFYVVET
jgi:hypothetical protein